MCHYDHCLRIVIVIVVVLAAAAIVAVPADFIVAVSVAAAASAKDSLLGIDNFYIRNLKGSTGDLVSLQPKPKLSRSTRSLNPTPL